MKSLLLVFLILLGNYYCYSQKNNLVIEYQYLSDVIAEVEQFYSIKVSYVDELLSDKIVTYTSDKQSQVQGFLTSMEKQTQLRFELVSKDYVIIRNFSSNDSLDICGYIVDINKTPISGTVILPNLSNKGEVTDHNGYFKITGIPYKTKIAIQHLGYNPRQLKAEKFLTPKCLSITMLESVELLKEVIVKEYLTTGISKIQKDIKIYPAELKVMPGIIEPDILQSIQQSPGINSPFETASGIHVRGGSPDQNLVLWNGIKTYNQGHFFGMLSAFNPYISEEVTFIKNGTSAKYGDRVAGVIDIRTKENVPKQFSGGAGLNMIYTDAYGTLPVIKDKLSVQLAGRRSYTDVFETITYKQMSDRVFQNTKISTDDVSDANRAKNNFFFNDFTSNIVFQPTKDHTILFNSLYNQNKLDFSVSDIGLNQSFNDVLDTENEGYNLRWKYQSESPLSIDVDAYYAKYLLQYEFRNIQNDSTELSSKKNLIRDRGFNLNSTYRFSDMHSLLSGYQFSNNTIQYAFEAKTPLYELLLDDDKNKINTHSLYAQYQFNANDITSVQAGLRINHYAQLDRTYYEPRIFAEQKVSDLLKFNVSAEYKTQTASQIKESVVSDLSLENQVWTLSSRDKFPVIGSYQYTAGANLAIGDWQIDAEAYLKNIDGITTLTFGFLNPIDTGYSKGESDVFGMDFFVKKYFNSYYTWLAYSYIQTENNFTGLNNGESFPGNWNIEHTIKWSHFYKLKDFRFSLGWLWHTGKAFTDIREDTSAGPVVIGYNGINQSKLPIYHRMDISAVYEINAKQNSRIKYRVGLSILNLYNRRNLLNREFKTTPSLNNELIDTRIYSLGITPNLVFRIFW